MRILKFQIGLTFITKVYKLKKTGTNFQNIHKIYQKWKRKTKIENKYNVRFFKLKKHNKIKNKICIHW